MVNALSLLMIPSVKKSKGDSGHWRTAHDDIGKEPTKAEAVDGVGDDQSVRYQGRQIVHSFFH